ncbi:hypothetical protein BsWGS_26630 [Bradybaena similaris]
MATSLDGLFTFPITFDLSAIRKPESKICVVSIFGKSRLNPVCCKASLLNPVIDRDIFQGTDGFLRRQIEDGNLECFYDSDSRVLYMHLLSCYDINILVQKCQKLAGNFNAQEFYTWCQEEDLKHAKALLLLFTLSHLVLLYHPGSTFDLSYLKLFRILDSLRSKLQHHMTEVLKTIPGVSKEWASFGRVCTPRMLLFFESPAIDIQPEETDCAFPKTTKKPSPMKKLQLSMEDMIYRVLRKNRAITNISNNSLFSLPNNQQFVYLLAKRAEVSDPVDFLMSLMRQTCFPQTEESVAVSQKPKLYSANRRKVNPPVPEVLPLSATSVLSSAPLSSSSSSSSALPCRQEQSVKEFLWQNIEMVFAMTINDNVGWHGTEPIFELPNLSTFLQAANSLYNFFFLENADVPAQLFSAVKNQLDISMRFSESRCGKVLPLAENAYQQDLPPFYVTSFHLSRLAKAQRVFAQYARGPAYDKYLEELQASCESYWKAGRQKCEAKSITGNFCTLKVHLLPTETPSSVEDSKKPVAEHSSEVKSRAACNCGRVQSDKDDPFDHKSANFDFYQALEDTCCSRLEHIAMPVFVPTTPDARAATIASIFVPQQPQLPQLPQQQTQENTSKDIDKQDTFLALSDLSYVLSLGQTSTNAGDLDTKVSQIDEAKEEIQTQDADSVWTDELKQKETDRLNSQECFASRSPPLRQHSTTEYLPYMIHSRSPPGLLPLFPSYSLCRLGSCSQYSHMNGVDLPGFLPGSNFLLPWDICVKNEQEKWPTVSETFGVVMKRQLRKSTKATVEGADAVTSVRVFLGMEYECPRGHRFFCSGPDKVIKVSSSSIVKDNASRLVQMDMPLYTACHYKQPKGCMAQMMRIYIVTPTDAPNCPPVRVQISPYIQPGPTPCPQFHPGLDTPLELPHDGIWVLRLPHIYRDENQTYLMPSDHHLLHNCYLLKGMFTYRIL